MNLLAWTKRLFIGTWILLGATVAPAVEYDVVVYGGTSGGVSAAVQVKRMGKSVIVIEPGKHLGGLSAGGLGATDIGNKAAIGGISREFYQRIFREYHTGKAAAPTKTPGDDSQWHFEPHVAEKVFQDFVQEYQVPVVLQERLDLKNGVKKEGLRIVSITMESGKTYAGKMFIDATYEGDLLAKAGCSYHVGREGNDVYQETLNGVQISRARSHQFTKPVDPYVKPGDPTSGLLLGIHDGGPGEEGQGDKRVQAYNFRVCLCDDPANKVPFPKPQNYNPARYELLRRYIEAGVYDSLNLSTPMPNRKTDTNNHGAFSSDNIGMNYDYPDGDYATREKIIQEHREYHQGMLYFLANDPRLPQKVRDATNRWGLAKDEFVDNGNWPHQIYVREARRLIADYVMTQHNCQGQVEAAFSVGLGAYNMDSHNVQRYAKNGRVYNEGDIQVGVSPYAIDYRAIVPKENECANLFVPICLSSTHIAYGSIRMEPVFMVLGQSSATAACLCLESGTTAQKLDYARLKERLLADKQVLVWTGPKRDPAAAAAKAVDPEKLPGFVADDAQAELTGEWLPSSSQGGFVGERYLHDNNTEQGRKSAKFTLKVKEAGTYDVRVSYTPNGNRATNVPVTVTAADKTAATTVNQRKPPPLENGFISVGKVTVAANGTVVVTISNKGADGHVIVDAVQLVPAK